MKQKRFISLLLAMALLLGLLPQMGLKAHAATASGNCGAEGDGSNLTWSFDEATGVLTISGNGRMEEYSNPDYRAPWFDYREAITTLVLPEGMISIGAFARPMF